MSTAKVESRLADTAAFRAAPFERRTVAQRLEAFISRLSTRNNFWHKLCSLVWLPYAFRSGITMKRLDSNRFRIPRVARATAYSAEWGPSRIHRSTSL